MTPAGELRHRIELQELAPATGTESRDARGHKVEEWVTRVSPWAKVEELAGAEQISLTEQAVVIATHRVTTRYHRSVNPTEAWSIKYKGRRLYIASVINVDGLNAEWQFVCGEKKAV